MKMYFKIIFFQFPIFILGYLAYKIRRTTPKLAYQTFRKLFYLTNGKFNDRISAWVQKKPTVKYSKRGILSQYSQNEMMRNVYNLQQNGFNVFDIKLDSTKIEALTNFARNTSCIPIPNVSKEKVIYDANNLIAPRYDFEERDLLMSNEVKNLITDESLIYFAQEYMGCTPILDLFAMWWSAPYSKGKVQSEVAQMYHFDMDRIKFIKFFFYLTEVDSETGPHCYIRGSHKGLPSILQRDGRFTDQEIIANFNEKDILELCGDKGTLIAVDTMGLHKGKPLTKGERLIFQIEFTNSLFGAPFNQLRFSRADSQQAITNYPFIFQRFN